MIGDPAHDNDGDEDKLLAWADRVYDLLLWPPLLFLAGVAAIFAVQYHPLSWEDILSTLLAGVR